MIEIRSIGGELPEASEETRDIQGYAAVFNSESVDLGLFTETIAPSAFQRSLRQRPDVVALIDHDTGKIVARVSAGNLEVREDERGLYHRARPIDTTQGEDLLKLVRGKLIHSMSFGFRAVEDEWEIRDGKEHRTIHDAELFEVSYVVFPAYTASNVESKRSIEMVFKERTKPISRRAITNQIKKRIALIERSILNSK